MQYWLMKSEPDVFGIDHLKAVGQEPWDGVRNYQARNMMRDDMRVGDSVLFYHSNTTVPGIVGLATVAVEAQPDYTAWEPKSKYFDPKSSPENPRWVMVEVAYERHLQRIISLAELKSIDALSDMPLVRKGNRLSIMPISPAHFEFIMGLEKL